MSMTAHFQGLWVVVVSRCLFSGVMGAGGCQGEVLPPITSHRTCFWGLWLPVRGHTPKNKPSRSFRGLWVVVVASERSTFWKWAVALVFGGCGGSGCQWEVNLLKTRGRAHFWGLWWWWLPGIGHTPQKQAVALVSGVVGGDGCQWEVIPPKMSRGAHFRGWCIRKMTFYLNHLNALKHLFQSSYLLKSLDLSGFKWISVNDLTETSDLRAFKWFKTNPNFLMWLSGRGHTPWKQAVTLIFRDCGWWLPVRGQPPKNEQSRLFSGIVVASERQCLTLSRQECRNWVFGWSGLGLMFLDTVQ